MLARISDWRRFWPKVDRTGPCWIWTGCLVGGYGNFKRKAAGSKLAHRTAYEMTRGPVPSGLTLDHLCRNRACVNPTHLEPVSSRVNILRGEGLAAKEARRNHCIKGHPFFTAPNGQRKCRECNRHYQATYDERLRARGTNRWRMKLACRLRQQPPTR